MAARVVEGLVDLVVWRGGGTAEGGTAEGGTPGAVETAVAADAPDTAAGAVGRAAAEAPSRGEEERVTPDCEGDLQAGRQGGVMADGSRQAGIHAGKHSAGSSGSAEETEEGGRWVQVGASEEGMKGEEDREDDSVVTHALASVKVLAGKDKEALLMVSIS